MGDTIIGIIIALVVVPLVMLGVLLVGVELFGIWGAPIGVVVIYLIMTGGRNRDGSSPSVYEPTEDAGGF